MCNWVPFNSLRRREHQLFVGAHYICTDANLKNLFSIMSSSPLTYFFRKEKEHFSALLDVSEATMDNTFLSFGRNSSYCSSKVGTDGKSFNMEEQALIQHSITFQVQLLPLCRFLGMQRQMYRSRKSTHSFSRNSSFKRWLGQVLSALFILLLLRVIILKHCYVFGEPANKLRCYLNRNPQP